MLIKIYGPKLSNSENLCDRCEFARKFVGGNLGEEQIQCAATQKKPPFRQMVECPNFRMKGLDRALNPEEMYAILHREPNRKNSEAGPTVKFTLSTDDYSRRPRTLSNLFRATKGQGVDPTEEVA